MCVLALSAVGCTPAAGHTDVYIYIYIYICIYI